MENWALCTKAVCLNSIKLPNIKDEYTLVIKWASLTWVFLYASYINKSCKLISWTYSSITYHRMSIYRLYFTDSLFSCNYIFRNVFQACEIAFFTWFFWYIFNFNAPTPPVVLLKPVNLLFLHDFFDIFSNLMYPRPPEHFSSL